MDLRQRRRRRTIAALYELSLLRIDEGRRRAAARVEAGGDSDAGDAAVGGIALFRAPGEGCGFLVERESLCEALTTAA